MRPSHDRSCHQQCPLLDVAEEVSGEAGLEFCEAMDGFGVCESCDHGWRKHFHTFNDQRQKVVKVPFQDSTSEHDQLEMFLQECEEAREVIMDVGTRFSRLLQSSIITRSGERDMISFLDGLASAQVETVHHAHEWNTFSARMAIKRKESLEKAATKLRGRVAALGEKHEQDDGGSGSDGLFGGVPLDAMLARLSNMKHWGKDFGELIRLEEARRQ